MADEQQGQERTESATPKRREDARKKGQVAKSRELPVAFSILAGALFFWLGGKAFMGSASDLMRNGLSHLVTEELSAASFQAILMDRFAEALLLLAPLMIVMVLTAVLSNVVQTGPMFSLHPMAPSLSKISPMAGVKRLFSLNTVMELLKSILKLVATGVTAYLIIKPEIAQFPALADMGIQALLPYIGRISFKIALTCGVVLLFLGGTDYLFQRFELEKKLKMSREEIKREIKEQEGDPMLRARIRSIQRENARRRMMADVPKADVVVTNPTHLAVALKYAPEKMSAPTVVAKGAGFVALKIREIARENGVPIMEDKPLARTLYKSVEVGREISVELYQAVAQVLAFVYRLNNRKATAAR